MARSTEPAMARACIPRWSVVETWFALLCFTLIAYAVMDGWNIGAGAVQFLITRNAAERRLIVSAIGPLWTWHEVWLIAAGGVLFAAFPAVLAATLAGFYLAVFVLLWCVLGRGLSLEFGGHIDDPLWRIFWDVAFTVVNILIAVLLGTALGNLIRGVPLDDAGKFSLAFFTDFKTTGNVGIIDWYTASIALFTLICTAAHGAAYLAMKTESAVQARAALLARSLWTLVFLLMPVVTLETYAVRPELFMQMMQRPLAWLAVVVAGFGFVAMLSGQRTRQDARVFLGGCAFIVGLLTAAAASLFPVMLHSTLDPKASVSAFDGAVGGPGLGIALVWWPVAALLSCAYAVIVFRQFKGRVRLAR